LSSPKVSIQTYLSFESKLFIAKNNKIKFSVERFWQAGEKLPALLFPQPMTGRDRHFSLRH
jgi:hypothetical protein